MNRKYVIIKAAANDAMAEIVANRIFTKDVADDICKSERLHLVALSLVDLPEGVADPARVATAEAAAKSFIKVYELVATEL